MAFLHYNRLKKQPFSRHCSWLVPATMLCLVGCLSAPDRSFFVKRKVYLPSTGGKPAVQFVKEVRHLLQAPAAAGARNRRAMRLALAGDWKGAGRIWRDLAKGDDCRVLNNLGVARDMEGRNSLAINRLARAYELCGNDHRIRWNYRSVLGTRAPSSPRYRIRDEPGGSNPRPNIGPRSAARKAAAEKTRRERAARLRREEAARRAKDRERARARAADAKRRAEAKRREEARRRAEALRRAEVERKRKEAERKRKEAERKRLEEERKRREAERKREPNTYFEP